MPQQPVLIARPARSSDEKILAHSYALLDGSKKLLQQGSPSSFLGNPRYGPFQLADETERTPKVGHHVILTDKQVSDLVQEFVEQRIVPPLCPHCDINMKWCRSKQAKQSAEIIENLFSCPNCNRIARVASWRRTAWRGG